MRAQVYRRDLAASPPLSASLIGARVRRARIALGWSPGRAADAAAVARERYMKIERGKLTPLALDPYDRPMLATEAGRIAMALGVTIADLTGTRA